MKLPGQKQKVTLSALGLLLFVLFLIAGCLFPFQLKRNDFYSLLLLSGPTMFWLFVWSEKVQHKSTLRRAMFKALINPAGLVFYIVWAAVIATIMITPVNPNPDDMELQAKVKELEDQMKTKNSH